MAITKKRKKELVNEYTDLVGKSEAMILTEYRGLTMPDLNNVRGKVRASGAEYHITKNRLFIIALKEAGFPVPDELLLGPTAVSFCFEDATAGAKALIDARRDLEALVIKGGLMKGMVLNPDQVRALAELPPREYILAQMLGSVQGPLAALVGIMAAPMRELAYILQQRGAQAEAAGAPAA